MPLNRSILSCSALALILTLALHVSQAAQAPAVNQSTVLTSNRGCTFAGLRNSTKLLTTGGGPYFAFTVQSSGSFTSDGRGPYAHQRDGVHSWLQNSGIRLYVYGANETLDSAEPTEQSRRLRVDLSRPVDPASPNLGVQNVSRWVVHWKQDTDKRVIYGLLDMPVGVDSLIERMEIHIPINGRVHVLRLGNLDVSVCWLEGNPVGRDTTPPKVRRISEDEWSIEIPPNSRAKLSERFGQLPDVMSMRFEDRGLYLIEGRLSVRKIDVP